MQDEVMGWQLNIQASTNLLTIKLFVAKIFKF
jgi:hypothetical protein